MLRRTFWHTFKTLRNALDSPLTRLAKGQERKYSISPTIIKILKRQWKHQRRTRKENIWTNRMTTLCHFLRIARYRSLQITITKSPCSLELTCCECYQEYVSPTLARAHSLFNQNFRTPVGCPVSSTSTCRTFAVYTTAGQRCLELWYVISAYVNEALTSTLVL